MAEFVEVMKQARRLCGVQMYCKDCPLYCENNDIACQFTLDEGPFDAAGMERIVLNWAAEHPEQVYPSWDEVWKNLFPGAKKAPCPRTFFGCECMVDIGCTECGSRPIPAEIAEKLGILAGKLGIRPKEG